jgi:hypothetical protein
VILIDMLVAVMVLVAANIVYRTLMVWWRHRKHRKSL